MWYNIKLIYFTHIVFIICKDYLTILFPETFPATMLSQPLSENDSDIDDHIPLKQLIKKKAARARIASDSEDD